jgi:hypothetical protein
MRLKSKSLLLGYLLVSVLVITGCSSGQMPAEIETQVPSETQVETQPPTIAPTATISEETVAEEPIETSNPETQDDSPPADVNATSTESACVECHSDQAMLIDTAAPVEEVESENEGAG